ncbi:MAG: MarR family transcriptional regulator [Rhodospirillaceae bacterium]|jgi:DNA-binding transcriptional regulator GbsR (MarR family)|nr:MarR family transcriptional regulator [Rhodospirillaceae bacterium]MBT6118564.1 MarR family transcriptional regulator [Rhodospirillaceae bacterium]
MELSASMERFVLHWGEMGTRWGVNRSVAQIHALLYLSPNPLPAEEIAEILGIARSNVSTSLKELQSWKLVRLSHALGDRRDHFTTETDLWQLLLTIVEERKQREIDPTLAVLRQCVDEAEDDPHTPKEVKRRMTRMLDFMETLTTWYRQMVRLPKGTLVALMKMGGKVAKLVS